MLRCVDQSNVVQMEQYCRKYNIEYANIKPCRQFFDILMRKPLPSILTENYLFGLKGYLLEVFAVLTSNTPMITVLSRCCPNVVSFSNDFSFIKL